jgi:multidrug efflux pump subunit AcrB
MTTVATTIDFAPLALNLGEGVDMLQPMAIGAIGGLAAEADGRLVFKALPILYALTTRRAPSKSIQQEC